MPHYLHQISYSTEGWSAIVARPQNRLEMVRAEIEQLGGKLVHGWFAFGEYDVIAITEMPDNVSAAALAIAFAAGGACKSVQSTPLLSQEDAIEAMKKAGECGYKPAITERKVA